MPITYGMRGSCHLCSEITGGVEYAVPLWAFLAPAREVSIYLLKMLCRNI
jgi:hypothetical protein